MQQQRQNDLQHQRFMDSCGGAGARPPAQARARCPRRLADDRVTARGRTPSSYQRPNSSPAGIAFHALGRRARTSGLPGSPAPGPPSPPRHESKIVPLVTLVRPGPRAAQLLVAPRRVLESSGASANRASAWSAARRGRGAAPADQRQQAFQRISRLRSPCGGAARDTITPPWSCAARQGGEPSLHPSAGSPRPWRRIELHRGLHLVDVLPPGRSAQEILRDLGSTTRCGRHAEHGASGGMAASPSRPGAAAPSRRGGTAGRCRQGEGAPRPAHRRDAARARSGSALRRGRSGACRRCRA